MAAIPSLTSIGLLMLEGAQRLARVSDTPELDAQVLLAAAMERSRTWVVAHPELELAPSDLAHWQDSLRRVEQGEPLPYVVGRWEFFNLEFEVTPDVLIPRPETELLVERAIAWLQATARPDKKTRVLDVGTGSGCIAIALSINVPGIEVVATDISPQALAVARRNARRLLPSSPITFVEGDLFPEIITPENEIPRKFHLVTANLPYIPGSVLKTLPVARHEPGLALDGGADGLDLIRRLLKMAPGYLEAGGRMLLEIEASQGKEVTSLVKENFPGGVITLLPDLSGKDRLVEIHPRTLEGAQ